METQMIRRFAFAALAFVLAFGTVATPAWAGGALTQIDITAAGPSPFTGFVTVPLVPIRWDDRCIPIAYRVNDTLDPIPNSSLSLAQATAIVQATMDDWNDIPTSYIEMDIVGNTSSNAPVGFDFVNEQSFITPPGFTAIASSPSVSLTGDTFLPDGADIDGDGDPDVSNTIVTCADVDLDGDIEFPEGLYAAGTILDNDVQYSTGFAYGSVSDNLSGSVELGSIAIHELGHSHGLSHVLNNQKSDTDGSAVTMYPFIDTGDADAEDDQRSLDSDDLAISSFYYPEGSATSGPGALQTGDVAFGSVYGLVTGELTHGPLDLPVAGGQVTAVDGSGAKVSAAYSGLTTLQYRVADGALFFSGDPNLDIVSGDYTLAVPKGTYSFVIEAPDGAPVPASSVSLPAIIGNRYGVLNFPEEPWNKNQEAAVERHPWKAHTASVKAGKVTSGIDFVTNAETEIANYGGINFIGFTGVPAGTFYAVRVPAAEFVAAQNTGAELVQAVRFRTHVFDQSTVPLFASASLTTGSVSADGSTATLDLANPLASQADFVGQDGDFATLYFPNSQGLGNSIANRIANGQITDLFIVLELTQGPFPGQSGQAPVIGLDSGDDAPIFGYSYTSTDGGATFNQTTNFNFMFSLVLSAAP